jgi:hypothetical protein
LKEPVLYLEFGVWRGDSIQWFAENLKHLESRFIGFDTFTGLPEEWEGHAPAGHFSTLGNLPQIDDSRVRFCKGLLAETLPQVIEDIKKLAEGRTVIVHIDADLFSSTLFVLTFLWPHINRYYVLFDEFFGEESLAVSMFLKTYPCRLEILYTDDRQNPNRAFGLVSHERH